jgi:sporulation protein YlmC with PRC-barrel domain
MSVAGFVSAIVLASALVAIAQQASQSNTNDNSAATLPANTDTNRTNDANQNINTNRDAAVSPTSAKPGLSKLDDKTSSSTVRASQLIGANIKNSNGDNVGEINDLVLDSSGKVRYAAVTYGGFLGLGSKMFAVPFEAFRVQQDPDDPNDRDDYVLTLNVTKEQLDGAQGFDNDHWPDFANAKMAQELDRRYNVNRGQADRSQNRNQTRQ